MTIEWTLSWEQQHKRAKDITNLIHCVCLFTYYMLILFYFILHFLTHVVLYAFVQTFDVAYTYIKTKFYCSPVENKLFRPLFQSVFSSLYGRTNTHNIKCQLFLYGCYNGWGAVLFLSHTSLYVCVIKQKVGDLQPIYILRSICKIIMRQTVCIKTVCTCSFLCWQLYAISNEIKPVEIWKNQRQNINLLPEEEEKKTHTNYSNFKNSVFIVGFTLIEAPHIRLNYSSKQDYCTAQNYMF